MEAGEVLFERAHCHKDVKFRISFLQPLDLGSKEKVLWIGTANDEADLASPSHVGDRSRYAHQGRNTYTTADEDDAVGLLAGEVNFPLGPRTSIVSPSFRTSWQVPRPETLVLSFDADLAVVALSRGGRDGVAALGGISVDGKHQSQELAR